MSDKFRFNGTGLEIGIPLSDADSSAISKWAENAADLARKHEQERIIKLLEDDSKHSMISVPRLWIEGQPLGQLELVHHWDCAACRSIELIKGETK